MSQGDDMMGYLFDYRIGHGRTYRLPLFAARWLARRLRGWDWDRDRPECLGCEQCLDGDR